MRELRTAGPSRIDRRGTLDYDQDTYGATALSRTFLVVGGRDVQATLGASYERHRFDMLRDRLDVDTRTGAVVPPVGLILPTKYFPASDVGEGGAFAQAEVRFGRLTLVPGVRYDRFSMDARGERVSCAGSTAAATSRRSLHPAGAGYASATP